MDIGQALLKLAIALALGLLVGLQRERTRSRVAGVRTFALITLLGAVAALAEGSPGWLVGAGAIALAAILVMANVAKLRLVNPDPGLTTEVAVLLMYCLGVYVVVGHTGAAVAVGGAVVLLLHLKQPLHRIVRAMGEHDVAAVMQFALITLVILPVLPNRTFGPLDVLNPYKIWLMVVLIVAISLGGYVALKLLGTRSSALLGGVLGGMISSTATTVSYARRTREGPAGGTDGQPTGERAAAGLAAMIIVLASAVSFMRVIVEIAVVAPHHLRAIGTPLAVMAAWMVLLGVAAFFFGGSEQRSKLPEPKNPAELKPALVFGALYAVVILAVAFVKQQFGSAGLYPVAIISGLTDMDAITLSTANLAKDGRLETTTAWRVILLAAMANIVFKGGIAAVLGSAALRGRVALYFALAVAGGAAILLLWR